MKVLVVGATGTIGKAVCDMLGKRHEILCIGHSSGDFHVDMNRANPSNAFIAVRVVSML